MLKVMKGDRPGRPPSGFSKTLWDLMVVTWVEQYAQKPRERPSASAVLTRLKECVDDWGESIIPLVPEDWKNTGSCRLSLNDCGSLFMSLLQVMTMISQPWQVIFIIGLVILLLARDPNDSTCSQPGFAILRHQLNRPAVVGTLGWCCA